MKKVIVIGAGIAGLTCGIYLRLNGFETEIYEFHTIPGGECTGWDRGGYHFDGCIHWLMGTKPETSLYKIWQDTGALGDKVKVFNHEIFMRYEEGDKAVNLYTNTDKLEKHLIEIAPEDEKEIKKFCGVIRKMGSFGMPIDRPMDKMTAGDGMKFAAKNFTVLPAITKYNKMKMGQFVENFKNPLLKRALLSFIPEEYTAMALLSMVGGMNAGDCGVPEGGSRAFAKRMEKRFLDLGGKVFYKANVDKILIHDGKATGIRLIDGKQVDADCIISCADGYATLKNMLEDKYTPPVYQNLFSHPKEFPTPTSALVFFGINTIIPCDYRGIEMKRSESVQVGGVESDSMLMLNYRFDPTMNPEGKTVMACYYRAEYDYWKDLYQDKEKYQSGKNKLLEDATENIIKRFPEAQGKIEVTDVVTPITYERYCNAWRGSWMTWGNSGKDVPGYYPGLLPGLDNFIIAGMWTLPPGGLPGAGASGRFAAHRLCMMNDIEFKTK